MYQLSEQSPGFVKASEMVSCQVKIVCLSATWSAEKWGLWGQMETVLSYNREVATPLPGCTERLCPTMWTETRIGLLALATVGGWGIRSRQAVVEPPAGWGTYGQARSLGLCASSWRALFSSQIHFSLGTFQKLDLHDKCFSLFNAQILSKRATSWFAIIKS